MQVNDSRYTFFFYFYKFILFIYFWLHWVCVAAHGLSLVAASRGCSSLRCVGFSLRCPRCGARTLGARASIVVARGLSSCGSWALERRLSSCGTQAQLLCGMWDLPGPGFEPMSPALAGRFLTTAPPGKSPSVFLRALITLLPQMQLWPLWNDDLPLTSSIINNQQKDKDSN